MSPNSETSVWRRVYSIKLGVELLVAFVLVAWLVAPLPVGMAIGPWWMLVWLLPTAAGVFSVAALRNRTGGT